jgi:hypothetical protein
MKKRNGDFIMQKSITCVVLALLMLLSCGLTQIDHPVLHDATEPNVLLATDESADTSFAQADDALEASLS